MSRPQTSPWKLGGLNLKELGKRTWKAVNADNAYDSAAALGYYFLFALIPMLIFLVSMLATFGSPHLFDLVLNNLGRTMPEGAYKLISSEMVNVLNEAKEGLLTFGIVATLWSASSGVVSTMDGLNRAYEVQEQRSFIKRRLIAIGLTIALSLLTIVGAGLLVASDQIGKLLESLTSIHAMEYVGAVAGIVFGLAIMFFGLELVYYYGPNVANPRWYWATPGSATAVVIFLIASFAFSLYVRFSNTYSSATYGTLGGVMLLMFWLYLLGLAIVIGGEVNSEIAKAARKRGNSEAPIVGEERTTDVPANDSMDGKSMDGKSINGKSINGKSVDGKSTESKQTKPATERA